MDSQETISRFLQTEFPQNKCTVESVEKHHSRIRHPVGFDELRPGNTVSGPTIMAAADLALYVAVLGTVGITPLVATSDLSIHFLRKPSGESDIIAQCDIIKEGKRLITGNVLIYSEGKEAPVAHAVGTYSIL